MIKSLLASFSKEFSVHKLYLTLKSRGIKLSKNTLYSYLSMLEDSMFTFFINKFKYPIRKKEFYINEVYLCDIGFVKLSEFSGDKGKKIENVVLLELKRKTSPLEEIFYWTNGKSEVDFITAQGLKIKQLIQVCHNINDYDTKRRETRALVKASKELKCTNLLVITYDYGAEERIQGKRIKFIPLWRWLLL